MDRAVHRGRTSLDRGRQMAKQVEEELRERILTLKLAPGSVLSRAELQEEFGLSNTPIRDALLKLDEEGLVEVYPQHATLVSRIDLAAAHEAHFLRRAVEIEAVVTVCNARNERTAPALNRVVTIMEACLAPDMVEEFSAQDREFHRIIWTDAGVGNLLPIIRRQSGHIDRLRRLNLFDPGKAERIIDDHRRIIAAVRDFDADAASKIMRQHLSGTLEIIPDIARRYPDYVLA